MMLLYGLLCSISAFVRRLAEWKHARLRKAYESAETIFRDLENVCKADEVALGRPVDYAGQLRLLKAYEKRELAKTRWVKAAEALNSRKSVDRQVKSFRSMRMPYTFGLIDMAFLMRVLDQLGLLPRIDQPLFESLYSLLSF